MNRRGFLGAILAAGAAPAIVKAGSLMPVFVRRDSGLLIANAELMTASEVLMRTSDFQRMYNYWMSQVVESMALAPKGPFLRGLADA